MVKLVVKSARDEDVYKDTVRVTLADRPRIVRAVSSGQHCTILVDDLGREGLALTIGQECEFEVQPAEPIGLLL